MLLAVYGTSQHFHIISSISCQKNAAAFKMSSCALISHVWVAYAESQWRHDPLQSTFEENAAGDTVGGWLIPTALSYLIEDIHKYCGLQESVA